jgi:hypothetical protein
MLRKSLALAKKQFTYARDRTASVVIFAGIVFTAITLWNQSVAVPISLHETKITKLQEELKNLALVSPTAAAMDAKLSEIEKRIDKIDKETSNANTILSIILKENRKYHDENP